MTEYQQLLQQVLSCSPYSQFKLVGEDDYRPQERNPHLSLSSFGLYDFKEEKQIKTLVEIGKELSLVKEPEVDDFIIKIIKESERNDSLVRAYYETRGLKISDDLIKDLKFTVSEYNGVKSIINPIINPEGKPVAINKVEVDVTGNKLKKKIQGRYEGDRATVFGNRQSGRVYCFEGLEDAVTFQSELAPTGLFLVSHGCGNFKRLNSFLKKLLKSGARQAFVVLDPDESGISLDKSAGITEKVTRLMPSVQLDCNSAHKEGKLEDWKASLTPVTPKVSRDTKSLGFNIITAGEVLDNRESDKDAVLSPILSRGEYFLIISPSGQGKSWIAMKMATEAAVGGRFLKWDYQEPLKVAYLDGEMGIQDCKERLQQTTSESRLLNQNLIMITPSDEGDAQIPNISDPEAQQYYDRLFDEMGVEMIVIDNYEYCSSLMDRADDMFKEWERVKKWINRHRSKGRIIILVDHTTTDGNLVQGVKSKHKFANVTLRINKPTLELDFDGSHMHLSFDKTRRFYGHHGEELYVKQLARDGKVEMTYKVYEQAVRDEIERLRALGRSRGYIIEKLHVPKYLYEDVVRESGQADKDPLAKSSQPAENTIDQIPFGDIM